MFKRKTRRDTNNMFPPKTWMFPKIGVHQNGWFIRENPIKMDDLGVALFLETPTCQGQANIPPVKHRQLQFAPLESLKKNTYLDLPDRKLGSSVRISGLGHLLINGVYWGYIPQILSFY